MKQTPQPYAGGHGVLGNADPASPQILRSFDAPIRADEDSRMPKDTRWKDRNTHKGRISVSDQGRVRSKGHFRRVELLILTHAPEDFGHREGDPVQFHAVDGDTSVVHGARSVRDMASEIQLQSVRSWLLFYDLHLGIVPLTMLV